MLFSFDPKQLFPLLDSIENTYEASKVHSDTVDAHLGFQVHQVEALIREREGNAPWAGLDPSTLLTPYTEIRFMLSKLKLEEGQHLAELGSGYSRMALVLQEHYPDVYYTGIESVELRAAEALRVLKIHGCHHAKVISKNLFSESTIPSADVYFLYDLSRNLEDSAQILEALKVQARDHSIRVVGRGLATRTSIERHHPWLSQVVEPEHFGNFSIYRS